MSEKLTKIYDSFIKDSFIIANGGTIILDLNEIVKISIVTNDLGPFLEDAFIYIYMNNEDIYFIATENLYFNNLYEKVSKFQDFDFDMMIKSMQCTNNDEFICWTKK